MRIAILGTGGTGGYFGGLLAKAGADVTFLARGAHLEAMRAHGLTVKLRKAETFTLPVKATDDPHEIEPVDLVLFCVKTYDTDATAEQIRPLIGPQTMLLSMQNGIDNEERIAQIIGKEPVIGAVALLTSAIEAPGVINNTGGFGKILLGELEGGTSHRTEELQNTLQEAGILAELRTDIRVALWEKLVFICAFSGITTLTRLPIGPLLAHPEMQTLLRQVMEEVVAVAHASGINLPANCVERGYTSFTAMGPGARGSMAVDLAHNRRLELDALNGTVVRLGREYSIATPLNFAIYAALKPFADGTPTLP